MCTSKIQCQHLQINTNSTHLKSRRVNKIFPILSSARGSTNADVELVRKNKKNNAGGTPTPSSRIGYKNTRLFSGKRDTIYIYSTHNNTIYTLANGKGETYCCVSVGMCGFKNTRKSTSYAAQAAAEKLATLSKNYNVSHVRVKMKGFGPGKLSGVRALHRSGFRVTNCTECTALPHNGCRPPKRRRI